MSDKKKLQKLEEGRIRTKKLPDPPPPPDPQRTPQSVQFNFPRIVPNGKPRSTRSASDKKD